MTASSLTGMSELTDRGKASGDFDWSEISPTIFGAVFESTWNPETRRSGGMHYTSIENIHKVIDPLFLDGLRSELEEIKEIAVDKTRKARLDTFQSKLAGLTFLDPACGSGNFLTETYLSLRKLENEVLRCATDQISMDLDGIIQVSIGQFYGIEINDFAVTVAKTALWIAESQMMKETEDVVHMSLDFLPLKSYANITEGNALRLDWESVVPKAKLNYIMGNPPYLGSKLQTAEQKADMAIALSGLKENKSLDYIASWFWKGANYIKNTASRYAFVTTNSICQGEQVGMLWSHIFDLGLVIRFARTSFKWSNNAKYNAGVTCAIVGVSGQFVGKRELYNESTQECRRVENINPYLSGGANTIVCKTHKTPPKLPKMCFGCMSYDNGNLLMSEQEKEDFIDAYPQDADLVKRVCGSYEFINQVDRFCFWIDDVNLPRAVANPYIAARIERTRQVRLNSKDKAGRELAERPHQFREYFVRTSDAIIIPRVSSERRAYIPIGYIRADTVVSDSAFAVYDAELWLFAILTSKLHNIWVRAVGGALETRIRYSATLCYNTFPFPKSRQSSGRIWRNMLKTY